MKKIMMVSEIFGGGIFTYVSQLCNLLCDQFDIYWVHATSLEMPADYEKFIDPRIHLVQTDITRRLTDPRELTQSIRRLRQIELEIRPDIIHLHSSVAGGVGRIAFIRSEVPVVYTPHGYAHILLGKGVKSLFYRAVEWMLGKTGAITLTCCESEDQEAKKLCKRTAYIETGIDTKDMDVQIKGVPERTGRELIVYTVGRACVQKQPQVFNQIAERLPQVRFIWIGGGELESELTAPNIEVTGWLPRKKSIEIAKGADVFILCSLGEAIAMSLIENMYLKKLCLVSNVMGNKSVIHDGVNGYVCNTAEEYALRIRDAIREFPEKLAEAAYRDVMEIYNTDVMKEKFVQFYERLME